jgi:hypothetical protein
MEDKSAAALKALAELGLLKEPEIKPEFADLWPVDLNNDEEFMQQVKKLYSKE